MNKKLNKFIAIILCLIMTTALIAAAVPESEEPAQETAQISPVVPEEATPAPVTDESAESEPASQDVPAEADSSAAETVVPEQSGENTLEESGEQAPEPGADETGSAEEVPENTETPAEPQISENVLNMLWGIKGSEEFSLRLSELLGCELESEVLQKLSACENTETFTAELKAVLRTMLPSNTGDPILEKLLSDTPEQFKAEFAQLKALNAPAESEPQPAPEAQIPVFSADTAKAEFLSCQTVEEAETFKANHSQEEIDTVLAVCTADELRAFVVKLGLYTEPKPYIFPIDYTNVGRLLPPLPKICTLAANTSGPDNGLETNKTAVENEDGSYTITLEAYTTGTVKGGEPIPVDVVLVLDESGSMRYELESSNHIPIYEPSHNEKYYIQSGNDYLPVTWCEHCNAWTDGCANIGPFIHIEGTSFIPKTSADDPNPDHTQFFYQEPGQIKNAILKASAENFLSKVHDDALKNNVEHKVSVIGFSGDGRAYTHLSDIRVESNYNAAVNAVHDLKTDGGTYVDDGLRLAAQEFENTPGAGRQRVVIVFTDGIPGSGHWDDSRTQESANNAISYANTIKNTYGATVYSIAMINDANPEAGISGSSDTEKTNRFLHYISSNFPYASSMNSGGSGSQVAGYYLAANSQEALNQIFGAISEDIATPSIDLGTETVVKDVISPYFNAPEGTDSIKAYSSDYLGNGQWAEPVEITNQVKISSNQGVIDVSGFDYTANFVSKTGRGIDDSFYGKKLIIKLNVTPKAGFLGGNSVPTNDSSSGVYDKGKNIEAFPEPSVDVPIPEITIQPADKHVYLNSNLTGSDLTNGVIAKCGETVLNDPAAPVEGWQKAFVTVGEPEAVEINGIKADRKYTVNMNITPKSSGSISSKESSGTANIFVYRPEITCNDSQIFLGETADYKDNVQASVKWVHGIDSADPAKMLGAVPSLSLAYNPEAGNFVKDTDVKLSTAINGEDVTQYTIIKNPDGKDRNHDFTVKVISGTLKITKAGNAGANEGFVFTVTGPDGFSRKISLTNGQSITISGLPAGSYTVSEDALWAWKYDVSGSPQNVEIGRSSPNGDVTVTNTLKSGPLPENGDCFVRNISETVISTAG